MLHIELPDQSTINLNAASQISYNDNHWNKARRIALNGEAYFDVTKGATFKVETTLGTVTVYGTQFNVKQRNKLFEVVCYEGLVGVLFNGEETLLRPGEGIFILNNEVKATNSAQSSPSWMKRSQRRARSPAATCFLQGRGHAAALLLSAGLTGVVANQIGRVLRINAGLHCGSHPLLILFELARSHCRGLPKLRAHNKSTRHGKISR